MKTLITIEVENEIGNPSIDDVKVFVEQIIEKGLVGKFDIHKYCPISGISIRVCGFINSYTFVEVLSDIGEK